MSAFFTAQHHKSYLACHDIEIKVFYILVRFLLKISIADL